jgi:hypothetical protein
MLKVILVTGDRDWEDLETVERVVDRLVSIYGTQRLLFIAGKAPGLDTMFTVIAQDRGVHVAEVQALWTTYHKAAGPMRNAIMVMLRPDLTVAFHPNIYASRGTRELR